jgi:hypothetical protein
MKEVSIKDLGQMTHFIGCHIIRDKNKKGILLHQPKLIKHLEEDFSAYIKTERIYLTPGAPKTVIMRPDPNDPMISKEMQTKYRSGVGMLLYLVKHSRPNLANAVRELSKVLDGATEAHWKSLLRTIKFVFDTKWYALNLDPTIRHDRKLYLEAYSDSEFAGDRDTRTSVYGFIVFFCGARISWKSKSNRSVTLSSTEAEYYACSEAAKELLFIKNMIEGIKEEQRLILPMTLRIDNTGAIYIANNQTTGPRTKHIDIRVHYVRNMILDNIFKTQFVKTTENIADIFTKNTSEGTFIKLSDLLVIDIEMLVDQRKLEVTKEMKGEMMH